ncbi:MAG: hypothetical protein HOA04_01725 [Euryarchaeota archaeon]|nr:hypothetical protein [Euryarchaeota archaeon]
MARTLFESFKFIILFRFRLASILVLIAGHPNVQTTKPSIEPVSIEGSIGTPNITEFRHPATIPMSTPIPKGRSTHNRNNVFLGGDLAKDSPVIYISVRPSIILGSK